MIYVYLYGRIGNNLFQLAAAASLAHKCDTEFYAYPLDYWCPEPDKCTLKEYLNQFGNNLLRNVRFVDRLPPGLIEMNESEDGEFRSLMMNSNNLQRAVLHGWFTSHKYFVDPIVRQLFEIDPVSWGYIKEKYGEVLFNGEGLTSILVRRGDYLKIPEDYAVCSMPYYRKAIDYIGRKKRYFVISDDIEWCRRHFRGDNFFFVEDEAPVIDLYLQSLCANNIISNSTFGWWGAWLNKNPDKIVVAPEPWYGWGHRHRSTHDLIPDRWVRLHNRVEPKYRIRGLQNMIHGSLLDGVRRVIR